MPLIFARSGGATPGWLLALDSPSHVHCLIQDSIQSHMQRVAHRHERLQSRVAVFAEGAIKLLTTVVDLPFHGFRSLVARGNQPGGIPPASAATLFSRPLQALVVFLGMQRDKVDSHFVTHCLSIICDG